MASDGSLCPPSDSPLVVAVYGISKDEVKHVTRFLDSVREADLVVIADTGSSDGTAQLLREQGAIVHQISIQPWRFDDARNVALALVPAHVDVCVSLDLDEVLAPGWRPALERAWSTRPTRLRYPFISSWTESGQPGVVFRNDRIHARHGYRWQMPIHEVVVWCGETDERIAETDELTVHHHPCEAKSRASYLSMLERAASESPNDVRCAHYLGREYMFRGRHREAICELTRGLELPQSTWLPQRAEACRFIGRCHDRLGDHDSALTWYWKATVERPEQRETWVDLSRALYQRNDFSGGYYAARRAIEIKQRASDYFSDPEAWGPLPHDLLSICAWKIGLVNEADVQAQIAAELAPNDDRIQANLRFFRERRSRVVESV